MGDNCLRIIATILVNSVNRSDDIVARYGGEEFSVILPSTDENGARIVASRLLKGVRDRNIPHKDNTAADCVTISIGVTTGMVKYPQSGTDYIKRADEALYISKNTGRNKYTFMDFK